MSERAARIDPARVAAHRALCAFEEGRLLQIDARGLDDRSARFARELAFGVVRRQRLLDHALDSLLHVGRPAGTRAMAALRLGAYQLAFLDRIPRHAAVDQSVELAGGMRKLVNAVLRRLADRVGPRRAESPCELDLGNGRTLALAPDAALPDPVDRVAVVHGLPSFLVQRWWARFGEDRARGIAAASCATPAVHLRVTRRCGGTRELVSALAAEGVEVEPAEHDRVVTWRGGRSPFAGSAFARGWFVAQDPTALRAVEALAALPGENVLDLCAAPGTKATELAEAVGEGGRVVAFDVDPTRRARIAENATRLGLSQLAVAAAPDGHAPYDAVLVDAPCSNTGVLARRVEVRRRLRPDVFAELARTQRALLDRATALVRAGGRIVYSTCSIEAEENEDVVRAWAAAGGVEVAEERLTLPSSGRHDGGFVAVTRRR